MPKFCRADNGFARKQARRAYMRHGMGCQTVHLYVSAPPESKKFRPRHAAWGPGTCPEHRHARRPTGDSPKDCTQACPPGGGVAKSRKMKGKKCRQVHFSNLHNVLHILKIVATFCSLHYRLCTLHRAPDSAPCTAPRIWSLAPMHRSTSHTVHHEPCTATTLNRSRMRRATPPLV